MNAHPHFDRRRRPGFILQLSLGFEGSRQCIAGCMKCCGKGIADDPKDEALIQVDGLTQDCIVARQQFWQLLGMVLREFGATFNICEEKSDSAGRASYTSSSMND
jgi:hypothetical protein